jgi:hypothetical protein
VKKFVKSKLYIDYSGVEDRGFDTTPPMICTKKEMTK